MLGLNSGLLGVRRVPAGGNATGLWTPNEQSLAQRAGIWPIVGAGRFFAFYDFSSGTVRSDNLFGINEARFFNNGVEVAAPTASANFIPQFGSIAAMANGSSTDGFFEQGYAALHPTMRFDFDFGVERNFTHVQFVTTNNGFGGPNFPQAFSVGKTGGIGQPPEYIARPNFVIGNFTYDGSTNTFFTPQILLS